MYDTVIIGAGASGLAAGIALKARGKRILILEGAERAAKKLAATGNGKCNLGNASVSSKNYNSLFVEKFLGQISKVYSLFADIGLKTKYIEDRLYPYSESASTVVNLLRAQFLPQEIRCSVFVDRLEKKDGKFILNGEITAKSVILATGTAATLGCNSHSLYTAFGHKLRRLQPALCPLITDNKYIKGLKNLRFKAKIALLCEGKTVAEEKGEILFRDNGVSGIAAFMLSTALARHPKSYTLEVDFAPDMTQNEVEEFLKKSTLEGMFHSAAAKSIQAYAREKGIREAYAVKNFDLGNVALSGEKYAQVLTGGLDTAEFTECLESRLISGAYACGEVLDVDGECGGYNLLWAFLSGTIAGENA